MRILGPTSVANRSCYGSTKSSWSARAVFWAWNGLP